MRGNNERSSEEAKVPINVRLLEQEATRAAAGLAGKSGYVRSGDFIRHFQEHAEHELKQLGIPPAPLSVGKGGTKKLHFRIRKNEYVLGAYFPKELDVWLDADVNGPLLGISFKSMMSGVAQNVNNRWEELVGDAANIHSRFPMLSLGYVMILPAMSTKGKKTVRPEPLIDPTTQQPTELARQIERKLLGIRGRQKPVELASVYEEVALAVIDFKAQPTARLNLTFPDPASPLRIERFYDNLVAHFHQRNTYIP
jgi:hypothetical protein